MKKYFPKEIEPKWQQKWKRNNLYCTDLSADRDRYYVLAELPYSSGDLHMGHWFTFTMADVLARFKRFQGFNVLFPNGFDAFGLPAENAAIKHGVHPQDWTLDNVQRMKKQFTTMGTAIDWDKTMVACLPEYYKWNQWIFLKMLEKGLAYRGKALSNWCPKCQTVLANENVEAGRCWRCGTEVIQKEIEQWFLKITSFADRLLWQDPPQADWPKALRDAQNKWIGKSEGVIIKFKNKEVLEVFTTRPDTIFGATFLVLSPEHPLLNNLILPKKKVKVEKYITQAKKKSELERKEEKEKTGVFTGSFTQNPLTGEEIPIWVADYVLMSYGTGAIMAVPAHDQRDFEFAQKYNLLIKPVVVSDDLTQKPPYEGEGQMINSKEYSGLPSSQAREKISKYIVEHQLGEYKIHYHLHDWSISRQRYWGTPIPIIYCEKCGTLPVPEKDLPVELPYKVDYTPQGKPPLATAEEWLQVKCPKCGGEGKREPETMDTFVDSSWYFFRYLDPNNDKEIFDKSIVKNWMPLNIYFGGPEHTLGHALYSRFFTQFFHDLNLIDFDEYALRRVHHGIILGPDRMRMSKSRGNVINPDEQVKNFGADAVRIYLTFMGPLDIIQSWNPQGIHGVYHFLERVWGLFDKVSDSQPNTKDLTILNKTVKKAGEDITNLKYNTVIAALMEWLNHLSRKEKISKEEFKTFLLLLAPFTPHIAEELWEMLGQSYSIHQQTWPEIEEKYLQEEQIMVVVQINGKVRDQLLIDREMIQDKEFVLSQAQKSPKIQKFLDGKEVKNSVYVPGKVLNFVI